MTLQQFVEIIEKLVCGQVVDLAVEIVSDPPNRPRIGLDGFRLQARKFQVFLVLAVMLFELRIIGHVGVHCNLLVEIINQWRMLLHRRPGDITTKARGYSKIFISENVDGNRCLREAASSNKTNSVDLLRRRLICIVMH